MNQFKTNQTENSAHMYQAKTETLPYIKYSASPNYDQDSLNHSQTPLGQFTNMI